MQNQWEPDTGCNRVESHNPTRSLTSQRIVRIRVKTRGPHLGTSTVVRPWRPAAVVAVIRTRALAAIRPFRFCSAMGVGYDTSTAGAHRTRPHLRVDVWVCARQLMTDGSSDMASEPDRFQVEQHGTVCIVGFDSPDFLDIDRFDQMRNKLAELIRESSCQTLIIDLDGLDCLTSGVFGFFATLIDLGVEIQIANPSEQIQDILHTTRLNDKIDICFDLDQFRK